MTVASNLVESHLFQFSNQTPLNRSIGEDELKGLDFQEFVQLPILILMGGNCGDSLIIGGHSLLPGRQGPSTRVAVKWVQMNTKDLVLVSHTTTTRGANEHLGTWLVSHTTTSSRTPASLIEAAQYLNPF